MFTGDALHGRARRRRLWVGIDSDVCGLDGFLPETTVYLLLMDQAPLKTGRDGVPASLPTRLRSVVNSDGEGRRRLAAVSERKGIILKRRSLVFFMLDSSKAS